MKIRRYCRATRPRVIHNAIYIIVRNHTRSFLVVLSNDNNIIVIIILSYPSGHPRTRQTVLGGGATVDIIRITTTARPPSG